MKKGLKISLIVLALAAVVFADDPQPLPIVVNANPDGNQSQPAVVADTSGALLVAWRDSASGGERILMQGFDWLGHRIASVVQAASQLYDDALNPCMAINKRGQVILAWQEIIGTANRIAFRMFDITGTPTTMVLPYSIIRVISGASPAVAIDSIGRKLLVWTGSSDGIHSDIYGNMYSEEDTLGVANSEDQAHSWVDDVRINEVATGDQTDPAIAMDAAGRSVVVWYDHREDSLGIFCRAFSDRGEPLGTYRLNNLEPEELDTLGPPAVAAAGVNSDSSTFLVSWVETDTQESNRLILARVDIELMYSQQVMVVDTLYTQVIRQSNNLLTGAPALSGDADGNATLIWSELSGSKSHLYGKMFASSDTDFPAAVQLTAAEEGFGAPAFNPSVIPLEDGEFVMVWEDTSGGNIDVRMQRYDSNGGVTDPIYLSPGSGSGNSRAVSFLGLENGGYEMFWEYEQEDTLQVYSAIFNKAGRLLQAPGPVYADDAHQSKPVTASSGNGLQVLAWEDSDDQGYRIAYSIRHLGETAYNQKILASSATSHLGSIAADIDTTGTICMAYERWNTGASAPDLLLARVDSAGNSLGSQITVATAASGGGRMASVAASAEGNIMLVWRQGGGSDGSNAKIMGKVYSSTGSVLRNQIQVSHDTLEYIGTVPGPEVAASDSSGYFLVMWREFFSDRNLLYYRLYDSDGDSVQLSGGLYRDRFGSASSLSNNSRTYGNASVAVDSSGGFLVVWAESMPGGEASLYGARLDPYGSPNGSEFQVPGVSAAAMPVVSILDQQRVAVAWQDIAGSQISFLGVQLHFHSLLGRVLLASSVAKDVQLMVHVDGLAVDSAAVGSDGSFRFSSLPGGDYHFWVSAGGVKIAGTSQQILLASSDPPEVDMGVAAQVSDLPVSSLPKAGQLSLAQNTPNPFNPSTTISFALEGNESRQMQLAVYDVRGALVRTLLDEVLEPGTYRLEWDGRDQSGRQMASGVYFLRLKSASESRMRKMILLK